MSKDQFYFQGKYFDTSEEMFEYAHKWKDLPLEEETAKKIMDTLKKDIVMNIFLRGLEFTNGEFCQYVENVFFAAIKALDEEGKKCQEKE
jgi:hypothetical protein